MYSLPVISPLVLSPVWWLFHKSSKKHKKESKHIEFHVAQTTSPEFEIPDGAIIGGVEVLGGALLLIIAPVCPVVVGAIASGAILDGLRRVCNAAEANPQLKEKNKIPPTPQGGLSF